MTQATTISRSATNAWPIDTPDRILRAMAGSEGSTVNDLADKAEIAVSIVSEWLSAKVKQGLLLFNASNGTYCSLCQWPANASSAQRAS